MTTNDGNKPTISFKNLNATEKRAKIREIYDGANSGFITLDFFKKDGTIRSMNAQPAAIQNHLVEEYKNESTKQAVVTRRENNPNLLNVWDVQKSEIRSINLDTVFRVSSKGMIFEFETTPTEAKKTA